MKRGVLVYAYANNHYAGHAPSTIEQFRNLWSGKGFPNIEMPQAVAPEIFAIRLGCAAEPLRSAAPASVRTLPIDAPAPANYRKPEQLFCRRAFRMVVERTRPLVKNLEYAKSPEIGNDGSRDDGGTRDTTHSEKFRMK